jgi:DNA-directed RNA polymerase specialized sigma24 family protein
MPDRKSAKAPTTGSHPSPTDDEAIIELARLGDVRAWDQIVRRDQEIVFRVVFMLTGDATSSTEATRTTFMRAYRALPELPPGTPVRPWLLSIVATVARAQRRFLDRPDEDEARALELPAGRRLSASPVLGWAQAAALYPDVRDELRAGFGLLTTEERLAIAARYLIDLSRAQAAKLLMTDADGVERMLQATLAHLRSTLSDPGLAAMPADHLGWLVTAVIVGQLPMIPNVAPEVADRLARDAVTYPEQFGPASRMRMRSVTGLAAIPIEGAARTPASRS